jgi:uncharacterized membrane protein
MHIQSDERDDQQLTTAVYVLQALGFVFGVTFVIAVVINYLFLGRVERTWLEGHFDWQIRTFWFGLLWFLVGGALSPILIGYPILLANALWVLYRVCRGWMRLSQGLSMNAQEVL